MLSRPIHPDEAPEYDSLAQELGSLFLQPAWTSLFAEDLVRCGLFDQAGRLCGGFQVFREKRFGLGVLRDAPYTPVSGPFVRIVAKHPVAILEARRDALAAMAEFLLASGAALVWLSLDRREMDLLPFLWRGFKAVPGYTYTIDLRQPAEVINGAMTTKRRNDITKARRDGLVVRQVTDLGAVHASVTRTLECQGKNVHREHLHRILDGFATDGNSFALGAYSDDTLLATCFIVHDGRTAYYLLGAQVGATPHHGAGALALLEAIHHARQIGCEEFDFEGSVVPSIEKYFRAFGGVLRPYFSVHRGWFPVEVALKLVRRSVF